MSDIEDSGLADCEQVITTSEDESHDPDRKPSSKRKMGTGHKKEKVKQVGGDENGESPEGESNQGRVKGDTNTAKKATVNDGLKLVFRQLPPTLKSEEFLEVLGQIPEYNYYYYKPAEKFRGQPGHATGFINFVDKEDGLIMQEKFHNYMVLDLKGMEFYMSVVPALNQAIPKPSKEDPLIGTYKESERFKAFLERYNQVDVGVLGVILNEDGAITTDLMLREIEEKKERQKNDLESTPLLEFIRDKTIEDKKRRLQIREEEVTRAREKLKINKQNAPGAVSKIISKYFDRDRDHDQFNSNNKPGPDYAFANAFSNSNNAPAHNTNHRQNQNQLPNIGNSSASGVQERRNKERERKEKREKERRERRAKEREQRLAARGENRSKESVDKKFEKKQNGDSKSKAEKEDIESSTEKPENDSKPPVLASEKTDRSKQYPDPKDKYLDKPKTDTHRAGRRDRGRDHPKEFDSYKQQNRGGKDYESGNSRRKPEEDTGSGRRNYRDRGNRYERDTASNKKSSDPGTGESASSKKPEGESKLDVGASTEKASAAPGPSKPSSSEAGLDSKTKDKDSAGGRDPEKPEPKKKIVKKIIRVVKKVKGSESEEGKGVHPVGESSSSRPVTVKKVIKKSVSSSDVKGEAKKAATATTEKDAAKPSASEKPSGSDETGSDTKNKEKKTRGRPDLQIYKPGGLRRGETAGGAGPSSASNSRPKTERDRERDNQRANNKNRGQGYGGNVSAKTSTTSASARPAESTSSDKPSNNSEKPAE